MFHGDISPEIARGIKVLRERIERAQIPPSQLDETLKLATWNIREFGRLRRGKHRTETAIHYIAEILSQFDLVAIVELRSDMTDMYRVMDILGPYWSVLFSDYNTDNAGNSERIAYLYDERAVGFTGLAAEADPLREKNKDTGKYESAITWWRSPFMASFRAGNFDFILITVHIRWAGSSQKAREPEIKYLAEWVDRRVKDKHVIDKDFIVVGDFNIPSLRSKLYKAVTSKGLSIPDVLLGKKHGSNLARNKRYDQILHYKRHTKTMTDKGGILDFYEDNWRALFPEDEYPSMKKYDFTFELSDHLPLWVQLDTWVDDEELDQILGID